MPSGGEQKINLRQYADHSRQWRNHLYVYPVISRRSRGLSIGINLNPDMACNFDCIYCQVDRTAPIRVRQVDLEVLRAELNRMVELVQSGLLFQDEAFSDVPPEMHAIRDFAFSGDGEPTTCPLFLESVQQTTEVRKNYALDAKLVLITDACYLTRPQVEAALRIMDDHAGEIWAKLDAGTESYYQLINKPNYPLSHVMKNIIAAATVRPVVIQSLFMCVHGEPTPHAERLAFVERLREVRESGGAISHVQVYTVARRPAEDYVTPLSRGDVDDIVQLVTEAGFTASAYYGME